VTKPQRPERIPQVDAFNEGGCTGRTCPPGASSIGAKIAPISIAGITGETFSIPRITIH